MKSSRRLAIPLNTTSRGVTALTITTGSGKGAGARTGALACTEKQIGQGVPRLREGE